MILVYGECRKNSEEARRMSPQNFPNRCTPAVTYFIKVEIKERTIIRTLGCGDKCVRIFKIQTY